MKKLLFTLLFAKGLKFKNVSPVRIAKSFRRETKLPIMILTNIALMTFIIIKYVFTKVSSIAKKEICQETVVEVIPENVINFTEYKLKKAK